MYTNCIITTYLKHLPYSLLELSVMLGLYLSISPENVVSSDDIYFSIGAAARTGSYR